MIPPGTMPSSPFAHLSPAEQKSRLEFLTRTLNAIAITLDLETWDDLPAGDSDAVLVAVEKAMNARTLAAFVRGQRAARAAKGEEPDAVPDAPLTQRKMVKTLLEAICLDAKFCQSEVIARSAREALRLLDLEPPEGAAKVEQPSAKIQTGTAVSILGRMKYAVFSGSEKFDYGDKRASVLCEYESHAKHMAAFWGASGYYEPLQTGELLTREKIREAVRRGLPGANAQAAQELVESITSAVCELLSAAGARAIPDALNQCHSYHAGLRCSHQEGHKGPHQEGNEVWYA